MSIRSMLGRRHIKKSLFLLVIVAALIAMWGARSLAQVKPKCPVPLVKSPDVVPLYGKMTCPVVGHIGNVKLAIPGHYVSGPVAYKGVDIWNAESYRNRPKHPTLDTEVDNFPIRIRLNNFRPIESRKDMEDYDKTGKAEGWKQPPENRWIFVEFKTVDVATRGSMKIAFENWIKDKDLWGPFIRSPSIWNLDHYVSTQQPAIRKNRKNPYFEETEQYEFYYDPKTEDTFAICSNALIHPLDESEIPHEILTDCEINFLLRDLKLEARISSIRFKDDLARWPEIEQGIRQIVQSFIVP